MPEKKSSPKKLHVDISLKETTNDVLWKIARYQLAPIICDDPTAAYPTFREQTEEELRSHPSFRANLIKFLLEEAAFAVEDWIDQQTASRVNDDDIHHLLLFGGIRFDFVPCSPGQTGTHRRGLAREEESAVIDELLAKISQETDAPAQ